MNALFAYATAALLSSLGAALLVATRNAHGHMSFDFPGAVQKSHVCATPRIGGLSVVVAVLAAALVSPAPRGLLLTLVMGAAPAATVGLVEDLTKRVRPGTRLAVIYAGSLMVCLVTGTALQRLDIPFLDALLTYGLVGALFTAFAVAGMSNAFNIIDGCHGLSSGTAVICLSGLGTIAMQVGDTPLAQAAFILAASLSGFLAINFPWGKLFLGDSGAYFAGFSVGWIAVLLVSRNQEVSPWAALLVCAYPVTEVLYSVYRRLAAGARVDAPDRRHLHNVIAFGFVQKQLRHFPAPLQSAASSALLWILPLACSTCAALCYSSPTALFLFAGLAVLLYHGAYRRFAVS